MPLQARREAVVGLAQATGLGCDRRTALAWPVPAPSGLDFTSTL